MPCYLYHCKKCDKDFEAEHSINEVLEKCPTCENTEIERLIAGGTSFILSGSGWASSGYSSSK